MFRMTFWKKKPTDIAEIEAIANRSLMEIMIVSTNTNNHDVSKSLLEASRLLRTRAETQERAALRVKGFKRWVQRQLGIDEVREQGVADVRFMGERLKYTGDILAKYNAGYHIALMESKAQSLEAIGEQLPELQDKKDMEDAALSIRQLAGGFIDGKVDNKDNNEHTESAAT